MFVCITGDGQNNPLASNVFPDSEIIIHLTLFLPSFNIKIYTILASPIECIESKDHFCYSSKITFPKYRRIISLKIYFPGNSFEHTY